MKQELRAKPDAALRATSRLHIWISWASSMGCRFYPVTFRPTLLLVQSLHPQGSRIDCRAGDEHSSSPVLGLACRTLRHADSRPVKLILAAPIDEHISGIYVI